MFKDPINIQLNGNAKSLPRVYEEKNGTAYRTFEGDLSIDIAHSYVAKRGRRRSMLKLTTNQIVADAYVANTKRPVSMSAYVVIDSPLLGFSAQDKENLVVALADYLKATSNEAAKKLIGGES